MNTTGALRAILRYSIVVLVVLLSINNSILKTTLESSAMFENIPNEQMEDSNQEYTFNDLGIIINQFTWSGKGTFQLFINKTFDLENNGPIVLVLEFSSTGDKPDSPGYEILGEFNQEAIDASIPRWMIESAGTNNQIIIPLEGEGRIYSNYLEFTIEATNNYDPNADGTLQILGSSKFVIGDNLLIEDFGQFSTKMFNDNWLGTTALGGIKAHSYVHLTINNETLLSHGTYQMQFSITIQGAVSASLFLYDKNWESYSMEKNQTDEFTTDVSVEISPHLGVNLYTLETSIYSESIWSTSFNVSISTVQLNVEYTEKSGFGFGNLEIAFFTWPSYPIVGVVILALWILPYSILKYRAWKKLPGEVEINFLDDEDAINILDPEGLSVEDQDDDIDETYDFEEDD